MSNRMIEPGRANHRMGGPRKNVRFAGAQIPVTFDVAENVKTIKEAIDWAAENNVDYLLTPEAALSGYYPTFMETPEQYQTLQQGEQEVVSHAKDNGIGLCLGTLFLNNEEHGSIKRNQVRFYNKSGDFVGAYNKVMTIAVDNVVPGEMLNANQGATAESEWTGHPITELGSDSDTSFEVSTLICNDMYGENKKGESLARSVLFQLRNNWSPIDLILHPTYGLRGTEVIEEFDLEQNDTTQERKDNIRKSMEDWHRTHLEMMSYQLNTTFLVVDTCSDFGGIESKFNTSSPSGVVKNGEWLVQAPRKGKQYFYHDFNLPGRLTHLHDSHFETLEELTKRNPEPKA